MTTTPSRTPLRLRAAAWLLALLAPLAAQVPASAVAERAWAALGLGATPCYHLRATQVSAAPGDPPRTIQMEEWVEGGRLRLEQRVKVHRGVEPDRTFHHLFDGQQNWARHFRTRPGPLEKVRRAQSPFLPLQSAAAWEKLRKLDAPAAEEVLCGVPCYRLTLSDGKEPPRVLTFWIDKARAVPLQVTVQVGGTRQLEQRLGDYRSVSGRLLPFRIEVDYRTANGQAGSLNTTVEHLGLDVPASPERFRPPDPRPPAHPDHVLPDPALPERLKADVLALVDGFPSRDDGHPEVLDKAAAHLATALAEAGGRVTEQPFMRNGRTYRNVLAAFGPEEGPRLVVGAHYDAVAGQPGADDNASGVAGLLELARAFGRRPPGRRVDLAAYCLEETGMVGSETHARSLRETRVDVRAMISLEMLGCYLDEPGTQELPSVLLRPFYPDRGNFLAVVTRLGQGWLAGRIKRDLRHAGPLPVTSFVAPRWLAPDVGRSDHAAFWAQGYPAVMVTDTANLRNRAYHSVDDVPERLDYRRMAMAVLAIEQAVRGLAGL